MNWKIQIVLALLLIVVGSCNTTQPTDISPESYQGTKLIFGNGGGFTGQYESYVLLENGFLYKSNDMAGNNAVPLTPIDKRTAKQMIENFSKLELDRMIMRNPGNLSYFIEIQRNGKKHRLIWGGTEQQPRPIVEKYYLSLYQLAQSQDFLPVKQ